MHDPGYTIFIVLACIWILMGVAGTIALLKSDNQELRFGKWGLVVAIPIVLPIVLVLLYQILRPFILPRLI